MHPTHINKLLILIRSVFRNSTGTLLAAMLIFIAASACNQSTGLSDDKKQASETWAEKLGYPKGKKVLLLHMDDIGMCPEANAAAERYIENGHLVSAAVMMPCPEAEAFINWAKEQPAADIGLHLTLTSEWKTHRWPPLTNPEKVPGLMDPEEKLWRSVPEVVTHATAEEVETEIRAQIEKSLAMGHTPTHIDTHMGTLYGSPEYVKVFFDVAQEYNIPANAIDLSDPDVVSAFKKQGYPINDVVISLANKYRLPKLDNFSSVPKGSTYEEKRENFFALVKSLKPGLTEIIFHPSVETDNLRVITGSWQQRVWEAEMFSDPVVRQFLEAEGIVHTNWREIMERFEERKEKLAARKNDKENGKL
ncbi:MAG TPA: polysaccharide deacetylase family protein [Chryseosolibacter sp.]|nr:polysaccharide deacetylase family protein [Chryseosolibacter sp.]